jgi:hypothetical protein
VAFRHHSGTEAARETAERSNSATLPRAAVDRALLRSEGGDSLSTHSMPPVTLMRRFVLASLASAALIVATWAEATWADATWADASAAAKCAKGEVWGDLGCQPKTQPSPMARAAKKLKARFQKTKPVPVAPLPAGPAPMLD